MRFSLLMPEKSTQWLRLFVGMGERRKLGDVALDLLLFAGMVRFYSAWQAAQFPNIDSL